MDNVVAVGKLEDTDGKKSPADGSLDKRQSGVPDARRRRIQQTRHRQNALRTGLLWHEALQRVDPSSQPTRAVGTLEVNEPLPEKLREGVEICLPLRGRKLPGDLLVADDLLSRGAKLTVEEVKAVDVPPEPGSDEGEEKAAASNLERGSNHRFALKSHRAFMGTGLRSITTKLT